VWSFYLNDLSLTIPDNVGLTSLTIQQDLGGSASGAVTSALGKPGIASVTFTGQALSNNDVAAFLDSLAKEKGYVDPYFSSATKSSSDPTGASAASTPVVTFTASVTVTDAAKSGRYTQKAS
jgi:Tfp pilus assembly protein PilN